MSRKTGGIILACVLGIFIIVIAFTCGPEPTELPELPVMTNEEQDYISALLNNANTMDGALEEFSTLMIEPQIGIDKWTLDVATQLTIIRLAYDEAAQMNPPASMVNIHSKYMQAMNNFNDATYLIASGIDNLDIGMIEEATNKMELGAQYIEETADLIVAFRAAHSIG